MKLSKAISLVLTALTFQRVKVTASSQLRRRKKDLDVQVEKQFPLVYTATIPHPRFLTDNLFTGKLDLLDHAVRNEKNGASTQVTFMVHSEQELNYIKKVANGLARFEPIAISLNATASQHYTNETNPTSDYINEVPPDYDNNNNNNFNQEENSNNNNNNNQAPTGYSTITGFPCYRDLRGMEQFMINLEERGKNIPNLDITRLDIGDSFLKTQDCSGGYHIWALNITGNGVQAQGLTTEKGIFFAMTGLHPREYTPPELGARFAEMLVAGYGNNADITAILDHTEVHLVLQANPDGRFVAETQPFLYRRKNMNGNATVCGEGNFGVDLNRNFPFRYGLESGSSSFPCSSTYRGVAAASEPEVQAITKYASEIFPRGQRKADPEGQIDEAYPETSKGIFIDIHSFGEYIIFPWGHENRATPNGDDLKSLVDKQLYFNRYNFSGPTMNFMFMASGPSDDWAYGALGAAAMTYEVGTEFYESCSYFESNVVPGNLAALLYSAKVSRAPYVLSKGPDVTNITLSPPVLEDTNNSTMVVTAKVSDNAYSIAGFGSSKQSISSGKLFLDRHPYDVMGGYVAVGLDMNCDLNSAGSIVATLSLNWTQIVAEISGSILGRHTVYIQGRDSDGYVGPVTAAYFEITESFSGASPPGYDDDDDALQNTTGTTTCEDTSTTFMVDINQVGTRNCSWLSINMYRFDHLCDLVEVGRACPKTCSHCELFG